MINQKVHFSMVLFVNDVWKPQGVITCYFSNQSIKSD